MGTEDRGQGQVGSHLAGVLALTPSTQHVILDDLTSVVGRVLVALVTDPVPHNGNHHLLQLVGRGQQSCGEGLAENQGWSRLLLLPNNQVLLSLLLRQTPAVSGRHRESLCEPRPSGLEAATPGPGT